MPIRKASPVHKKTHQRSLDDQEKLRLTIHARESAEALYDAGHRQYNAKAESAAWAQVEAELAALPAAGRYWRSVYRNWWKDHDDSI
jgi:hypothetical protein